VPPSNADEEEDDGDQHDGARHGHDDVQPQVEVGAPRNTANLLGLSKRNERFKIDTISHQYTYKNIKQKTKHYDDFDIGRKFN
jgi:hypothetical protein